MPPMSSPEPLQKAQTLVASGMEAVERRIDEALRSDVAMIPTIGRYIVGAGGKRMRPLILLLSARLFGGASEERMAALGAAIEFIHTASLLHDDVVDAADERRGRPSANGVWGNQASVLVGDFLFSRAFELLVADGDPDVLQTMAQATNALAEGEVLELARSFQADMTQQQCLEVIERKTAVLFRAAAKLGAIVAGAHQHAEAMAGFGMRLGVAFQLMDDALDYASAREEAGKPVAHDLGEGKITLPLIHAMRRDPELSERVRAIADRGGYADEAERIWVRERVQRAGGVEATIAEAERFAAEAKALLPEGEQKARQALAQLADFSARRPF